MHVLAVVTNFAENEGGVQGHLKALLPRLVERGHRVTVVYLGAGEREWTQDGVEVIALRRRADVKNIIGVPSPADWRAFRRRVLEGRLKAGPVDVVATHTRFFPMSALGCRLAKSLQVPVVHTEHGSGSVVTGSNLIEGASRLVDATIGRYILRTADEVVAVSEAVARFVGRMSGREAVVVPNGIDMAVWLAPEVVEAPRGLVFVGRIVQEKGWRDFLTVAAAVRRDETVPIHVIGDGLDRQEAEDLAREMQIDDVVWHGRLGPEEIRPVLTGNVYVNPSHAAEGFQLTLLEALACGASVITYDVGGARDLEAGRTGDIHVVPVGDVAALAEAAMGAVRTRSIKPDPAVMERWDWNRVAEDYVSVLDAARSTVAQPK